MRYKELRRETIHSKQSRYVKFFCSCYDKELSTPEKRIITTIVAKKTVARRVQNYYCENCGQKFAVTWAERESKVEFIENKTEMKKYIKEFMLLQSKTPSRIIYEIKNHGNLWNVEVHTIDGLFIKTKLGEVNADRITEFLKERIKYLENQLEKY